MGGNNLLVLHFFLSCSDCIKLRDSLLYEFGSNLMTRSSLWQLGMDYLQFCSEEGEF